MAVKTEVHCNAGHPWDKRPGFDIITIDADLRSELVEAMNDAERRFWHPWLTGTNEETGKPGGVMYKPCGIEAEWSDSLHRPHPGGVF